MASSVVSDNFETSTGAIPNMGGADITTRLCSAWVNFDGTGTVAITASYNVSSITDNGVGRYTVNFTTAMPDADYVMSGSAGNLSSTTTVGRSINRDGAWTTSACLIRNVGDSAAAYDNGYIGVMFFAN